MKDSESNVEYEFEDEFRFPLVMEICLKWNSEFHNVIPNRGIPP